MKHNVRIGRLVKTTVFLTPLIAVSMLLSSFPAVISQSTMIKKKIDKAFALLAINQG